MDQISQYLWHKYPNNFITGSKDCNLLLWGADSKAPGMCTLTLGVDYDPLCGKRDEITAYLNEKYKRDRTFQRLYDFGIECSRKGDFPFRVITYPSMRATYENRWEQSIRKFPLDEVIFYQKEAGKTDPGVLFKGSDLRNELYTVLGVSYEDRGTSKDQNDHLADYFHLWSRMSLTKSITKLDLDGFLVNEKGDQGILIEIKRSGKPPIPWWKPKYDKPDYRLQLQFANMAQTGFWLLHHENTPCDENKILSFYNIVGIDEEQKEDFLITRGEILKMPLSGEGSLEEKVEAFILT